MIVANLNALREWERNRESTEPEIPDVDRNPGTEDADPATLEDGSHGRKRRERRGRHERGLIADHKGRKVDVER